MGLSGQKTEPIEKTRARLAEIQEANTKRAVSWLLAFLQSHGREARKKILSQAKLEDVHSAALGRAAKELGIVEIQETPASDPIWSLPEKEKEPAPQGYPTLSGKGVAAPRNATLQEEKTLRRAPTTSLAKELLRRKAYHKVRALDEMTERDIRGGEPCPTCKRGMPRSEDVRLRAVTAFLDRAGVAAPRGAEEDGERGPLIVFPPGTKIAVLAQTSTDAEVVARDAAQRAEMADREAELRAGEAQDAELVSRAADAAERVQLRRASDI